jgi:hypothetical protein
MSEDTARTFYLILGRDLPAQAEIAFYKQNKKSDLIFNVLPERTEPVGNHERYMKSVIEDQTTDGVITDSQTITLSALLACIETKTPLEIWIYYPGEEINKGGIERCPLDKNYRPRDSAFSDYFNAAILLMRKKTQKTTKKAS